MSLTLTKARSRSADGALAPNGIPNQVDDNASRFRYIPVSILAWGAKIIGGAGWPLSNVRVKRVPQGNLPAP